ncbi:hypothetical protein IT568_11100 [bacterium]|nr:hypothetical protein [bacterium]
MFRFNLFLAIFMVVLFSGSVFGQFAFSGKKIAQTEKKEQTEFSLDQINFEPELTAPKIQTFSGKKKNPLVGALLSAVIPGLGQFYAGDYVSGSVYLSLELATYGGVFYYNKKGDDKTKQFKIYADEHWFLEKYYGYLITHYEENAQNPTMTFPQPDENGHYNLTDGQREFLREYEENNCGSGCSHRVLSESKDRNYYENIYKYYQFSEGWDDVEYPGVEGIALPPENQNSKSEHREIYKGMRNKANSFYSKANVMSFGFFATRLVSAVHAAIAIKNQNNFAMVFPSVLEHEGKFIQAATLQLRW